MTANPQDNSITSLDRAKGSILGLVAADALGSTVEFTSAGDIKRMFGPAGQTDMRGGGSFNWAVGEYTDDSQMMLCLLQSLVATNQETLSGLQVDDLGRRFVAWYDSRPPDIGNTVRYALSLLKRGTPAAFSGDANPQSQANGAVMRCAPVAVLWHRPAQQSELIRDSLLSAAPTHRSPIAAGACVVANVIIAGLISGQPFETALVQAKTAANPEWQAVLEEWEKAGRPHRGNSGHALTTVLTALHCILTTSTFEEAVVKAVNGGDDADTVGAVTGEIAGALYAYSAIPERWLKVLKDRDLFLNLTVTLFEMGEK